MRPYLDLMQHVLDNGAKKEDRTGTGTLSVFGYQMRFDLKQGFPLLTTKKVFLRGIIHELLWFLAGDTNIKYLVDNKVGIWNEWPHATYIKATGDKLSLQDFVERIREDDAFAKEWGGIGPGYGYQWRTWPTPAACASFFFSRRTSASLLSLALSFCAAQNLRLFFPFSRARASTDSARSST